MHKTKLMSNTSKPKVAFYPPLEDTILSLTKTFDSIPGERKAILREITDYVESKARKNEKIDLVFICTHNSRRSHISQIWAQAGAAYYGIDDVRSYSGGTEATAFNPRAVRAMQNAGFQIGIASEGENPVYEVKYSHNGHAIIAFSKKYDSDSNPHEAFAAVMTCTHADENCPIVFGMEKRISLPYNDPKDFDGTPQEATKYLERVREIGAEILYAFSQAKV
jgi:arsenate reductase (thioredoxin)